MLLNYGAGEDLRVPWTVRRSNQSILKEINPEYSLEVLMPKLKLQCFGLLVQWANPLENTLMLGKIEDRRRRGWQRTRWLDGIMDMSQTWVTKSRTQLSGWNELLEGFPGSENSNERMKMDSVLQVRMFATSWHFSFVWSENLEHIVT